MKNSDFNQEKVILFNPFETNQSYLFDPQAKAKIKLADIHQQATKVGIDNLDNKEFCYCCGSLSSKRDFNLFCNIDDFLQYGPSITIAFKFMKYCAIAIFIIFIISNIFIYYFSQEIWYCQRYYCNIEKLERQFKDNFIYNKLNHISMLLITIILKNYLSYKVSLYEKQLEENFPNIESYTIQLKNLNKNTNIEVIQKKLEDQNVQVEKINKVYDIRQLSKLIGKFQLNKKFYLMKKFSQKLKEKQIEKNKLLLQQIESKAKEFLENKNDFFTGYAFVVLSKKQNVQQLFNQKSLRLFHRSKIIGNLHIKKASSPDDIIWTNYGYSKFQKIIRRLFTLLTTILITIIFFVIIYFVQRKQQEIEDKDNNSKINLLSLIISFIITLLNIILEEFFKKITPFEKRTTSSSEKTSDVWKFTIYLVFNMTIFLIIVYHSFSKMQIFGSSGLLKIVQYIIIISIIQKLIFLIFDTNYWLRQWKIKYLKKRMKKNPESVTQLELNEAKEQLLFEVDCTYSGTMKIYCVALFYQQIFPLACLFSAFEIFLSFWIQKYSFIRRSKSPQNLNFSFTLNSLKCFNFVLIFTAFGGLIWEFILFQKFSIIQIFIVIIILIETYIFSINNLIQYFIHKKHQNTTSFQQNKNKFTFDYDRVNPVTKTKSFDTWFKDNIPEYQEQVENEDWEDLVGNIYELLQKQYDYRIQLLYSSQNPFKKDKTIRNIIQQSYLNQQFGQNMNKIFKKVIESSYNINKIQNKNNRLYKSLEEPDDEDDIKQYGDYLRFQTIENFKKSLINSKLN